MNNWKKLDLCGSWRLACEENEKYLQRRSCFKKIAQIEDSDMELFDAKVPGNYDLSLWEHEHENSPGSEFFGENHLKFIEYENLHAWYCRRFTYDEEPGGNEYLLFEGLDTFAEIYLNGDLAGETYNMLIPHEIRAVGLVRGENEIMIHISPACIVARKKKVEAGAYAMTYGYAGVNVRRAAHTYGWDIMPRIVSGGIWRPVSLVAKPADRVDEAYIHTLKIDRRNGYGVLCLHYNLTVSRDSLRGYTVRFRGRCGDSSFEAEQTLWHTAGKLHAVVQNCRFWWPRPSGSPELYDASVELSRDGEVLDIYTERVGVRTVELKRTSLTDGAGNGEFKFIINDEPLFVKGSNWVPADAFHSRDRERMTCILPMLVDIGCNAVRCWGGNVYENDYFYDYCDENGLMVWQDFAMGCGVYPQDEEFRRDIEYEACAIITRLRNHASIVLWAGDNECDMAYSWNGFRRDPNVNVLTRAILPSAVERHDPARAYLPSSPYIDAEAYKVGEDFTPEQHIWGPRDYYKGTYYAGNPAHFASETGYHGCNSPQSIRKFIDEDHLWPYTNNSQWIYRSTSPELEGSPFSYRTELMAKQIRELFGEIPGNLEDFSFASQASQAEALKFFIELFRGSKWRKTGIIWWNLIDGWPQLSDAVVDYYGEKKLSYEYIKRSQAPVCFMFREARNWNMELVAVNDLLSEVEVCFTVADIETGDCLLSGRTAIPANSLVSAGSIPYSASEKKMILIRWETGGAEYKNHYLSGTPTFDLRTYAGWIKKAGLAAEDYFYEAI